MIKIITDDGADLPLETVKKYNIEILPIAIIANEKEHFIGKNITSDEMYSNMRKGLVYRTSQVTRTYMLEKFEELLKEDKEIIYLPLSSGISGTYETALSVKVELLNKYPEGKLFIIDSKSATMGQGMVTIRAAMLNEDGKSVEEIVKSLEEIVENQIHLFTVGDLEYLYRGGRLSKTSQIIGGLLNIMPILYVDRERGKIESIDKVRGFMAFLKKVSVWANKISKDGKFNPNQTVVICHGDWEEVALKTKRYFIEEMGVEAENVIISKLGCVIGAHTGPEAITIFFSADPKEKAYIRM
ncbi:MAG: DegV family protein [Tissierellia bacterium]|nr:DegV family protein [Tissierellia bacterium]